MRKSLHLVALLLVLVLPACSDVTVNTVWDTQQDFTGLRTFDWAPKEPESGPDLPYDILDRAIKRAVEAELGAAGFTPSSTNPSFRLTYYVGVEEVTRINSSAYYGPGWGGYWGYGWYGPSGVNVSQYDQGTLTLDLLSPDAGVGLIWRGVASGKIDSTMSPQQMEGAIEGAVQAILNDFPPEPER